MVLDKLYFAKLISNKSKKYGNLCLNDKYVGKVFLVQSRGGDGRVLRAVSEGGTTGEVGINWELLHD